MNQEQVNQKFEIFTDEYDYIATEIMEATDAGDPIVHKNPESSISKTYVSIVDSLLSVIK